MELAQRGDLTQVLGAAKRVPERVLLNEARRSLQILGCEDKIIANVLLGELYEEAVVALALARAEIAVDPLAIDIE